MVALARLSRLAMETNAVTSGRLIESDLRELSVTAERLASHIVMMLGVHGKGSGTSFFGLLASFAAIYLLILDRTNWRTKILTSLLIPYIYLTHPSTLFKFLSGEFGKWVALIAVVLRLFLPRHFPDWLEMPGSLILLLVVAPEFFSHTIRNGPVGVFICLAIGCYLLQEHIRASGGFRNSFMQRHGISNTIGIILLLVYPVWRLLVHH